jgi:hypothetical protein
VLVQHDVPGLDRQHASTRHRIAAVDGEVDDHLLDLAAVGQHRRRLATAQHADLDVLADQALQHRHDRGDHLVQVEHGWLEHLLPREREQLPRELRGALDGALDLVELLGAGARADARTGHLAVPGHHRQQVVEVVRHAAGELAHRLHLLRLTELALEPLTLADVLGDDAARRPALERHRMGDRPDLQLAAVLAPVLRHPGKHRVGVVSNALSVRDDVCLPQGEELLPRVAVPGDRSVVDGEDILGVGVFDPHGQRAALEEAPIAPLGGPRALLRLLPAAEPLSDCADQRVDVPSEVLDLGGPRSVHRLRRRDGGGGTHLTAESPDRNRDAAIDEGGREHDEQQAGHDDEELTLSQPVTGRERRGLVLADEELPADPGDCRLRVEARLAVQILTLDAVAGPGEVRADQRLADPPLRIGRTRENRLAVRAGDEHLDRAVSSVLLDEGGGNQLERDERGHVAVPRRRRGADNRGIARDRVSDRCGRGRSGRRRTRLRRPPREGRRRPARRNRRSAATHGSLSEPPALTGRGRRQARAKRPQATQAVPLVSNGTPPRGLR